jgi:hypothetical protein
MNGKTRALKSEGMSLAAQRAAYQSNNPAHITATKADADYIAVLELLAAGN